MSTFTTRPEILGTFGVVASTHWIASAVGMSILEKGGNAFDAAVATGMVLQVVEPHLNGPAGDLPAVIYSRATDKVEVICGQGPAPAGATIEHYRGEGLDLIPGDGLLATVIPGAFGGWMLMLRDYGRLSLRDVLEPAIHYAEHGHPVLQRVSATIAGLAGFFEKEWPTSYRTWLPGGSAPAPNGNFRNPVLARTWKRILREAEAKSGRDAEVEAARAAFYTRLRRRGDRRLRALQRRHGRQRRAAQGRADGRRHGRLAGDGRAARDLRLPRLDGRQDRPVGAGAGAAPGACDPSGIRSVEDGSVRAGFRPHGRRGEEARLRRPRGLLRRPGFRRSAARSTCCPKPTTPDAAS